MQDAGGESRGGACPSKKFREAGLVFGGGGGRGGGAMTDRFEVEEIVEQDAMSVLYKARDKETGETVALRRIGGASVLDFAKTGEEGKKAYEEIVGVLAGEKWPGIRKVLAGGLDKADGAPWVACEWLEEKSFVQEPPFAETGDEERGKVMEAVLRALEAVHGKGLAAGWLGFENLFRKADGAWLVELCPERMVIAKVGGVEVDHPFVAEEIKGGGVGGEKADLRGAGEFFSMLKKGTNAEVKVALSAEWIRFLGWLRQNERANTAEALARLGKLMNPDVISSVADLRRQKKKKQTTSRQQTVPSGSAMASAPATGQVAVSAEGQKGTAGPGGRGKKLVLLGSCVLAALLLLAGGGFFLARGCKGGSGGENGAPAAGEKAWEDLSEDERRARLKERFASGKTGLDRDPAEAEKEEEKEGKEAGKPKEKKKRTKEDVLREIEERRKQQGG